MEAWVFAASSVSGRGDDGGVGEDLIGAETSGSPRTSPDQLVVEIYQYFANRTSPGGDRASRRQRRREKEKQARRKLEPTPTRPLQGLWKATSEVADPVLPVRIRQFFKSDISNDHQSIPVKHTVPRFSVQVNGDFNHDLVIIHN